MLPIPLPYKILAGVGLLIAVFFVGYTKGSSKAEAELARYAARAEKQIADLERKNSEISSTVVTKYVDRVNVVKEKEYVYLERAKTNVPDTTVLSNGWVHVHDASATLSDADSARASDASPSGVAANQALSTVVSNYAACQANAEQLKSLQRWITDSQAAVAESNKKRK